MSPSESTEGGGRETVDVAAAEAVGARVRVTRGSPVSLGMEPERLMTFIKEMTAAYCTCIEV